MAAAAAGQAGPGTGGGEGDAAQGHCQGSEQAGAGLGPNQDVELSFFSYYATVVKRGFQADCCYRYYQ